MKHLLNQALQEIITLRNRNAILEAQMGVVEVFAAALGLKRNESTVTLDIILMLQKAVEQLEAYSKE